MNFERKAFQQDSQTRTGRLQDSCRYTPGAEFSQDSHASCRTEADKLWDIMREELSIQEADVELDESTPVVEEDLDETCLDFLNMYWMILTYITVLNISHLIITIQYQRIIICWFDWLLNDIVFYFANTVKYLDKWMKPL